MLKRIAVPSCNLGTVISDRAIRQAVRYLKRTHEDITKIIEDTETRQITNMNEDEASAEVTSGDTEASEEFTENAQINLNDISAYPNTSVEKVEIGVNVTSGDLIFSFASFISSDRELSASTGIESLKILDCIVRMASVLTATTVDYEKMSLKDKILMTFVKLKQNCTYEFLAVLFRNYTPRHCIRVVEETISLLSACFRKAVPWPSKEEVSRNLPLCFEAFKNVRVVLDCTEIKIQNPPNLCCELLTYSHYKHGKTVKIMTGVTPAGNISFVSQAFGGRASDKQIFEQSGIVKLLEPGDDVMVDRGFLIDDICEFNKLRVIRPPFLKGKKQFTKSEAVVTADIAKARVHIERSNQRIKNFRILSDTLPSHLIPMIDDIFIIICGTVNLSSPILDDSKFMQD